MSTTASTRPPSSSTPETLTTSTTTMTNLSNATWTFLETPKTAPDDGDDVVAAASQVQRDMLVEQEPVRPNGAVTTTISNTSTPGNDMPLVIYSIRHEIRSLDLLNATTAKPKILISGLKNTIALDFYYSDHEGYIFWTDTVDEKIYRGTTMNGTVTNVEVVIQTGLATVEGLAVDWVGKNIYWVESNLDQIDVANLAGTYRRTLIAGNMENPRAIVLDPRHGLLFWSDWDKNNPRIERASMSGEQRVILTSIRSKTSKGGWPNGLTLDYEQLRVYWIDANSDSIHTIDYDGHDHRLVVEGAQYLTHPFAITLFESNLYWTDWRSNTVATVEKNNGSGVNVIQRLQTRPFDIKIYHPSRQPKVEPANNPCHINNGNCSHLCLINHLSPGVLSRRCDCPHLMELKPDGLSCEKHEIVLLIGKTNEIRGVDLKEPLHHVISPISLPKVVTPKQFEFHAKSRRIFWADSHLNEVRRAGLVESSMETIIDIIIENPMGLALDWISENIYVAGQLRGHPKLYVSNLNGEFISVLMDAQTGLNAPKSLAVHPTFGLLFCADEESSTSSLMSTSGHQAPQNEPIIFMARMDGSDRRVITTKEDNPFLSNPSSLVIDFDTNRLYWVNPDTGTIQYYDLHEEQTHVVWNDNQGDKINPNVLCLNGDKLIVAARLGTVEQLVEIPKSNASQYTIIRTQNADQITALRVYNASVQDGTNACSHNNGNCSQLCLPTSQTNRVCKCTIGHNINPVNATDCVGRDVFMIFSYNWGMKGVSIEPNASPDDLLLPPIHRAYRASSLDFDHRNNLIYWVDSEDGSITRIKRDTTGHQVIVNGLEAEESIGIDWVAGNIYWIDPYYDLIEVARLDGSHRYVIISGNMDKASSLAVNPLSGYIVWSDSGSPTRIETAKLDGTNRQTVVNSSIAHISDIAIDFTDDYIYWIDSSSSIVERIKVNGTYRQVVLNNSHPYQSVSYTHPMAIAIYNQWLYVADTVSNSGSIIRYDKNNASDSVILQQDLGDGIKDILIFHPQFIPPANENPCAENNGGCADLCLYLGRHGERRCVCSHGRLAPDGATCVPFDVFIFVSRLSQIDSIHVKDESPYNSPYKPITNERLANVIALAVDQKAGRLIYSEIQRGQINSVLFNSNDTRVLVDKQGLVEGIAYIHGQLYWTSITDNTISRLNITSEGDFVYPPNTSKTTASEICSSDKTEDCAIEKRPSDHIEKLVRLTHEDKPRGIAVDKCQSFIYWTNWNQKNPSIQRATYRNNYEVESIIKTDIKMPNGITIDHEQQRLYWCDARIDKIEACDMDGQNRIVLVSAIVQHPFAIAVLDEYVFWTDWLARGVSRAEKYTGENQVMIKKNIQRPMGLVVVAPDNQTCTFDRCATNNGGCGRDSICKLDSDSKIQCIGKSTLEPPKSKESQTTTTLTPCNTVINVPAAQNTSYPVTITPITSTIASATQSSSLDPYITQSVTTTTSESMNDYSTLSTQTHVTNMPDTLPTDLESTNVSGTHMNNDAIETSTSSSQARISNLAPARPTSYEKPVTNWYTFVTLLVLILASAVAGILISFGRNCNRWFFGFNSAFRHRRLFDDHRGENLDFANPMYNEHDLTHCPFSIDLDEMQFGL
ncbi:Prolow-density lipoprotein receptor-related protein 1 [Fragariocoptes setiger]|uniref:Prolow-density lipoprotein receptor-related protein 1 n=1 Tax=Fragariocoptes setiger TaxID=1670756 RepID=A0ABQ7S818_9ACAR|nr:Prolow-density lipoprotein receptor-related protein 1 [Fragariocoptes setiger]